MIRLSRSFAQRALIVSAFSAALATFAGCGIGTPTGGTLADTTGAAMTGVLHGGPNPDVGARVVLYATTSNGYGQGVALQEASQAGGAAHQDTNQFGSFAFAGGYTCPAGQQAYVVAYGGNTGNNGNNPNVILVTALGPCEGVSATTSIFINEATTVAAAYTLGNFTSVVTDNSTIGAGLPAVFIGAPSTNNGASTSGTVSTAGSTTGCVTTYNGATDTYYPTCPATGTGSVVYAAAGLRHAFGNATAMVNTGTGAINTANANGGLYPTVLLNTIANSVQACVNSAGGGGAPTAGTSVISAAGTSHDGTKCGELFAFTSYTKDGTTNGASGTANLVTAGDTLSSLINLVKRPNGTVSKFDAACDSNSGTGTTTAATCIQQLASGFNGFFTPQLTAAPQDYTVAIQYPAGSFAFGTGTGFTSSCSKTTATNGTLYVQSVATDINDNVAILNSDTTTSKCSVELIAAFDGTTLGGNAPDTANAVTADVSVATDAYGHVFVPDLTGDGIRVFQYNANGVPDANDAAVKLDATITGGSGGTPATELPAYKAYFLSADGTGRVYIGSQNGQNTIGFLTATSQSHTTPAYSIASESGTTTAAVRSTAVDINSVGFFVKSTSLVATLPGGNAAISDASLSGSSESTQFVVADSSSNAWTVIDNSLATVTATMPAPTQVIKSPYTYTAPVAPATVGTLTFGTTTPTTAPAYQFPFTSNSQQGYGQAASPHGTIDGSNVIWFVDLVGSNTTGPPPVVTSVSSLFGYDTVNAYGFPQLQGCRTNNAFNYNITGYTINTTANTTTFTDTTVPPAVGSAVTLSNFPASSSFLNGQVVTVTAVVTTSGAYSFTVASVFGQAATTSTDTGNGSEAASTHCGSATGDGNFPSSTPYNFYGSRQVAVDSMGNIWIANGVQSTVVEVLGTGNPTLPGYIRNGSSMRP